MYPSLPPFLRLPTELICTILHYLEINDLLYCAAVNRHLRSIISNSSSLQYTLELGAHKFTSVLPLSVGPSAAKRLQCLRDREQAWRTLKWRGKRSFDLPASGSVYEFVGGYYGNGRDDDRKLTGSLTFFQLPTHAHGSDITQNTWTHPFPEVTIIDFTMDPAQDLLVIVSLASSESKHVYQMHLRTLSSNQPHPQAPVSILGSVPRISAEDPPHNEFNAASVRIQVVGNLVALLVKQFMDSVPAHLEIWDWNAGSQNSVSLERERGIDDFTLLSSDTFLVVRPSGMLEVLTFEDPAKSSQKPRTRAVYELPVLSDGYIYWYISLTSNPSVGPNPNIKCPCSCSKISRDNVHGPRTGNHDTNAPSDPDNVCLHCPMYYPSAADRIHACCLYVLNPNALIPAIEQVSSFVFFIDVTTFLIHSPSYDMSRIKLKGDISAAQSVNGSFRRNSTDPSAPLLLPPRTSSTSSNPPYPPPRRASSAPPASQHIVEPGPRAIPWEQWGPNHTRWFRERISTDWQHALYGYRTVETIGLTRAEEIQNKINKSLSSGGAIAGQHEHPQIPEQGHGVGPVSLPPAPTNHSTSSNDPQFLLQIDAQTLATGIIPIPLDAATSSSANGLSALPITIPPISHDTTNGGNMYIDISDDEDAATTPLSPFRTGPRRLRVRDFNPHHTRRAMASIRRAKAKGKQRQEAPCAPLTCQVPPHLPLPDSMFVERLISEPSVVESRGVFVNDIVSKLPYREVLSRETFNVSDVMLDECRILLLKRAHDGQLQGIDVLMM